MSTLVEHITDTIRRRPGASFPELTRALDGAGHDTAGTFTMGPRDDLVMWAEVNRAFADAMEHAMKGDRIHPHALGAGEAILVHSFDGGMLKLPIAKRPPLDRPYVEPHWLPVVWYAGRRCGAKDCPNA